MEWLVRFPAAECTIGGEKTCALDTESPQWRHRRRPSASSKILRRIIQARRRASSPRGLCGRFVSRPSSTGTGRQGRRRPTKGRMETIREMLRTIFYSDENSMSSENVRAEDEVSLRVCGLLHTRPRRRTTRRQTSKSAAWIGQMGSRIINSRRQPAFGSNRFLVMSDGCTIIARLNFAVTPHVRHGIPDHANQPHRIQGCSRPPRFFFLARLNFRRGRLPPCHYLRTPLLSEIRADVLWRVSLQLPSLSCSRGNGPGTLLSQSIDRY
jgi:hypothetical protein